MAAISQAELERFFEELVARARALGASSAITSGMACVRSGVAAATRDCDMLCSPEHAGVLLGLLAATPFRAAACAYRGHLTAPLDVRWLRGGWTSHFWWAAAGPDVCLDVFGAAPRASVPWERDVQDGYAGLHTVAEMKRTNRERDWPVATGLGLKLLRAGDLRGWLHIFDHELLLDLATRIPVPAEMVAQRPILLLVEARDARLEVALKAEVEFWHRLDRLRLRIYRDAARSYALAVQDDPRASNPDLRVQHQARVALAVRLLAASPLPDHGIERLIAEAREETARMVPEGALGWLPDVRANFVGLGDGR